MNKTVQAKVQSLSDKITSFKNTTEKHAITPTSLGTLLQDISDDAHDADARQLAICYDASHGICIKNNFTLADDESLFLYRLTRAHQGTCHLKKWSHAWNSSRLQLADKNHSLQHSGSNITTEDWIPLKIKASTERSDAIKCDCSTLLSVIELLSVSKNSNGNTFARDGRRKICITEHKAVLQFAVVICKTSDPDQKFTGTWEYCGDLKKTPVKWAKFNVIYYPQSTKTGYQQQVHIL